MLRSGPLAQAVAQAVAVELPGPVYEGDLQAEREAEEHGNVVPWTPPRRRAGNDNEETNVDPEAARRGQR